MDERETMAWRREDHCTHPEWRWCDCDWCRVGRAEETVRQARSPEAMANMARLGREAARALRYMPARDSAGKGEE
jgi:hypothetical protein